MMNRICSTSEGKYRYLINVIIGLLVVVFFAPSLFASGTNGKVSGIVEDAVTGEPLVGATVRVDGYDLATSTDEDGEYFIIGVPVGKYSLVVTYIGFETVRTEEVRILVDLTTPVSFKLNTAPVELDREVVVRASSPIIQADLTSSRSIFTAERLASMPNTISVDAILTNYPGVVTGKSNEMHVRGGRADQVAYYLDGFSVVDPFTSQAGMRILPSALEELSLMSGGFTAEYGNAMSGIVNAVTREGGSDYRGQVKAYEGFTKPYNVTTGEWDDLSSIDNRSVTFDVSGPIPGFESKKHTFFVAGEMLNNSGYLPHDRNVSYVGLSKFVFKPAQKWKIKTNFEIEHTFKEVFVHRDVNSRSYDFNLKGLPVLERDAYTFGLSSNYAVNEKLIVSLGINRFATKTHQAPEHLMDIYWDQWPGYSVDSAGDYNGTIHEDNYMGYLDHSDPYNVVGYTSDGDFQPTYSYREANYNAISASVETQLNKSNQLKSGFEFRRWEIKRDFKQFYNLNPYTQFYTSNPKYVTMYLQDKLEYDYFVMNFGMRMDYRNNDISYNLTAREQGGQSDDPANDIYVASQPTTDWSPRIGVSFPISEKSVMHFNYGIYYQIPRYGQMFFNLEGETESGLPIFGNPDLKPERTVSYELGLDHLIGNSLRFDITAFYKDISDLVSARPAVDGEGNPYLASPGSPVTLFQNGDYGSVEGFDISLEKLRTGNEVVSGSVAYSYMTATGNASTANEAYYTWGTDPDATAPVTVYPLDFDQRHTVTGVFDVSVPRGWKGEMFGMTIPDSWGLTMVGYYGSGLPYTKVDQSGNRLGGQNEHRLPVTYSVDMRFNKNFHFGQNNYFLTAFVEIDNLFDRRNIINVYARTGLPNDDATSIIGGLSLDADELDRLDGLFDHDPQNYSPPRTIRTGLVFNF